MRSLLSADPAISANRAARVSPGRLHGRSYGQRIKDQNPALVGRYDGMHLICDAPTKTGKTDGESPIESG
jgi:hypothetical protein